MLDSNSQIRFSDLSSPFKFLKHAQRQTSLCVSCSYARCLFLPGIVVCKCVLFVCLYSASVCQDASIVESLLYTKTSIPCRDLDGKRLPAGGLSTRWLIGHCIGLYLVRGEMLEFCCFRNGYESSAC